MQNPNHIRAAQKARADLDNSLVNHTRFAEALKRIEAALLFPTDIRLLWVIGPTGAGKTRLMRTVEKLVNRIIAENLIDDPGCIPCVSIDVPCPELGHRFSWAEHYSRYLEKLEVPLIPGVANVPSLPNTDPRRGLEHAVVNALRHRRPKAVLMDETNHFASVTSPKVLFDQTNRIKSFVNRTDILHICFGTYEVARMAGVSGQLARRSEIIHFARYRPEVQSDRSTFKQIARAFQKCLPVAHHLDLTNASEFLHERSIGCVGVLKSWLIHALAHANGNGRSEITMKDIEATALPVSRLRIMLKDAVEGENSLTEGGEQLDLFRDELGLAKESDHDNNTPFGGLFDTTSEGDPSKVAKSSTKPGTMAPRRIPTGRGVNGELGVMAV